MNEKQLNKIKQSIKEATYDDNLALIEILSREILDIDENNQYGKYFFNYSRKERNPKLLKSFLCNEVFTDKDELTSVLDHIIDYLRDRTFKEAIEFFIAHQKDIDQFYYLSEYYDYVLNIKYTSENNYYPTIVINDEDTSYDKDIYNVNISKNYKPDTYLLHLCDLLANAKQIYMKVRRKTIETEYVLVYVNRNNIYYQEINDDFDVVKEAKRKLENTFKVTILDEKDNVVTILEEEYGEKYKGIPSIPLKGYDLLGFICDDSKEIINNGSIVKNKSNHILKPSYKQSIYKITFYDQGEIILQKEIKYNEKFGKFPLPKTKNMEFLGFYLNDKQINEHDIFNLCENVSIYAHFGRKIYEVLFKEDENTISSKMIYENDSIGKLDLSDKKGTKYTEYYVNNIQINENYIIKDNTIVNVGYTEIEYTVTFYINNEVYNTQKVKDKCKVKRIADPIDTNYSFCGWYLDKEFTQRFDNEMIVKSNLSIYGKTVSLKNNSTEKKNIVLNTIIEFGSYPNEVITDQNLIDQIKVYGEIQTNGYIKYRDQYYEKIISKLSKGKKSKFTNQEVVLNDTEYYFKVSRIKWKVIEENEVCLTLLSNDLLDACKYDDESSVYMNSYIRRFINTEFYEKAFSDNEKERILVTQVDNSPESTSEKINKYACENTNDKVYLLSYKEATAVEYGFVKKNGSTKTREVHLNDYALARGGYNFLSCGNGCYWLRSPCDFPKLDVWYVDSSGVLFFRKASIDDICIRPMIRIKK